MKTHAASLKLLLLFAAFFFMTGCASRKPATFHATWYWVEPVGKPAANDGMSIALVNVSSTPKTIVRVIVNPLEDRGAAGWIFNHEKSKLLLEPGDLMVIRAKDLNRVPLSQGSKFDHCRVPLRILVALESNEIVVAKVVGFLPSALPQSWGECPQSINPCSTCKEEPQ